MKTPKQKLKLAIKNIILEQIKDESTDSSYDVEAEVVSDVDKVFVTFTVDGPISFSEIETQALDEYYNQGGLGDDFNLEVINLSVDGQDVSDFHSDKEQQLDEDDEMMKTAMANAKGKVDPKAVMNRIGGKLEMSPEERREKNLKGRGAQLGMAESTKQKIKKIIKEIISEQSGMMSTDMSASELFDKIVNDVTKHGKPIRIKTVGGEYLNDEAWKRNNTVYRKTENQEEYIINRNLDLVVKRISPSHDIDIRNGTAEDLEKLAINPFQ